MTEIPIAFVAGALVSGAALGAGYFAILLKAARLHAQAAPLSVVAPLYLLRGALAIGVFWGLAQLGALPLLAGLVGFVAIRLLFQRMVAET